MSLVFIACLALLLLWFKFQYNDGVSRLLRPLFLLGLVAYVFTTLSVEAQLGEKIATLGKGLLILATSGTLISVVKDNKWLFWGSFFLILTVCLWFWMNEKEIPSAKFTAAPDGELLIELQNEADLIALASIADQYELIRTKAFTGLQFASPLENWYVLDIPTKYEQQLETIFEGLTKLNTFEGLEINEQIQQSPLNSGQAKNIQKRFGLNDPGVERLWAFEAMELDKWKTYLEKNELVPQKKARIAILDTGVDGKHEDLKDNYVSLKPAYDTDRRGHGTHVAGIAAAVANNGVGISSLGLTNDFVEVTSVKVLNAFGGGTQQTIINGIIEATNRGADVINLSLGGYSSDAKQKAYAQAAAYAAKKNVVILVSAGNSNISATKFAPANTPGVIAVSAIGEDLARAAFSNTVDELEMGVAAPGVNIYSSIPNNQYATYNGTSMSAPYVSGLVGILKSLNPNLNTQQVFQIFNTTGVNTKSGDKTGRLIIPHRAVAALD